MYHEVTYSQLARQRRRRIVLVVVVAALLAAIVAGIFASRSLTVEQGAASVRSSIIAAAVQCCAVEGSYPSSLSHLEQDYGLVLNHNDYAITYEWLGDNIPPSVKVVVR